MDWLFAALASEHRNVAERAVAKTDRSNRQEVMLICLPVTKTTKRIAVVAGDGIGKEVIPAALEVIRAATAASGESGIQFTEFDWSADRYLKDGTTIPDGDAGFAMLSRDFDAIFVGALGDPRVPSNLHAKEILLGMRFKMDLYANVRPVKLLDESLCPLKGVKPEDVDFVVIRENTEGPYVDAGGVLKQGTADEVATQEDVNTRKGVERVIRFAFDYAKQHRRKKVLMCDKSNVMTFAGGLWQRVFKLVAAEYSGIATAHMYVDALCMHMVRDPRQFDVIVTNNMFGDIITDLAAALQGGLGMAASGNIHPGRTSMFEPVHGSAPPFAGKNIANPIGAILTAALMLEHLGLASSGARINAAVLAAVQQKMTTQDIGGKLGTKECAAWIAKRVS
jgi:3-isopropylmalate dehydrogenase